MQWYCISPSTDEKIIGTFPQTDGMGPGYDLKGANSVWNIPNLRKPAFKPDFDCFRIDKKAKLTDVISTTIINACGFIVNDKVKNIFDKFKLPPHIYYPVKMLYKKEMITNYYWLHFTVDNSIDIDFKNSTFELTHPLPFFRTDSIILEGKELSILTANKLANPNYKFFPKKIKLQGVHNIDFMVFDFLYEKFYIDDTIFKALDHNSITGLKILSQEIPIEF